jgi:two-component system KDP operon response regulator KdpE
MAILHVEDQAVIRDVVRRALEAYGFSVVSADGVEAGRRAVAEREDLAGALLDVRLKDGSGVELYEWIASEHPALAERVAFVTGSAETWTYEPLASYGCPVVSKPFEIAELARLAAAWETAAQTASSPSTRAGFVRAARSVGSVAASSASRVTTPAATESDTGSNRVTS